MNQSPFSAPQDQQSEQFLQSLAGLIADSMQRKDNKKTIQEAAGIEAKVALGKHDWNAMPMHKLEQRLNKAVGKAIAD